MATNSVGQPHSHRAPIQSRGVPFPYLGVPRSVGYLTLDEESIQKIRLVWFQDQTDVLTALGLIQAEMAHIRHQIRPWYRKLWEWVTRRGE